MSFCRARVLGRRICICLSCSNPMQILRPETARPQNDSGLPNDRRSDVDSKRCAVTYIPRWILSGVDSLVARENRSILLLCGAGLREGASTILGTGALLFAGLRHRVVKPELRSLPRRAPKPVPAHRPLHRGDEVASAPCPQFCRPRERGCPSAEMGRGDSRLQGRYRPPARLCRGTLQSRQCLCRRTADRRSVEGISGSAAPAAEFSGRSDQHRGPRRISGPDSRSHRRVSRRNPGASQQCGTRMSAWLTR